MRDYLMQNRWLNPTFLRSESCWLPWLNFSGHCLVQRYVSYNILYLYTITMLYTWNNAHLKYKAPFSFSRSWTGWCCEGDGEGAGEALVELGLSDASDPVDWYKLERRGTLATWELDDPGRIETLLDDTGEGPLPLSTWSERLRAIESLLALGPAIDFNRLMSNCRIDLFLKLNNL